MRASRWLAVCASAVLVAGVAAGITYALWSNGASVASGVIRSGTLDLVLLGSPTWAETAPVSDQGAVGGDLTVAHLTTPGDALTLTQQFRTDLVGDNLAARLKVSWSNGAPPSLLGGRVTATYHVMMPSGATTTETPLGTALVVPSGSANLTPANASGTWTLVVTLSCSGSDVVVPASGVSTAPTFSTGDVVIELDQVRDGDGFQ